MKIKSKVKRFRLTKAHVEYMTWLDGVSTKHFYACQHKNEHEHYRRTTDVLARERYIKLLKPNKIGMQRIVLTAKGRKAISSGNQT